MGKYYRVTVINYNSDTSTIRLQLSAVNIGSGFSRDFYLYMIIDNLKYSHNDSRQNVYNRKINDYDFVEINIYTSAPNSAPIFPKTYMASPLNYYDLKIVDPKRKIGAVYSIYSENSQPMSWKFEIVYNKKKNSYEIKSHENIHKKSTIQIENRKEE